MTGSTRSCPGTEPLDAEAPGAGPPATPVASDGRMRRWLVTAVLGLTWLPGIVHSQEYEPRFDLKAPAIIAQGQALFNRRCAGRCHGQDGLEGFDAPILRGKVYLDRTYVWATLVTGRPSNAMPSWKGRLSDDELWEIIAFVSSLGDQASAAGQK